MLEELFQHGRIVVQMATEIKGVKGVKGVLREVIWNSEVFFADYVCWGISPISQSRLWFQPALWNSQSARSLACPWPRPGSEEGMAILLVVSFNLEPLHPVFIPFHGLGTDQHKGQNTGHKTT